MKIRYRDHEIEAKRERSMGGVFFCYYNVIREIDQYVCVEDFGGDTVKYMIKWLKKLIDLQLARPDGANWDEWEDHWDDVLFG